MNKKVYQNKNKYKQWVIPSCICILISVYFKGIVHAGIGETQLNNLFSAMNVHV